MARRTIYATVVVAALLSMFHSGLSNVHAQSTVSIDAGVQPFVDREELAGAVMLVANKDNVLSNEAVGWGDVAARNPMQADSIFWIASQSKPITAAALMMLVDEGKVNVDDPVEKFLPEFHGQMVVVEKDDEHVLLRRPTHPITVKNVLSHTSGLSFQSALEEPTLDLFPLAARVRSYAMTPLEFEPDSKYQYSNAGINTVARIIEVVAGMPFEQFLDDRLFHPLGMEDTTFWPSEEQVSRIAKSYKPGPDNQGLEETTISQLYYPLTDRTQRFPMPAGGLFSTAHDVARFYQMLLSGGQLDGKRYLSESAVGQLTSRQTPNDLPQSYGLNSRLLVAEGRVTIDGLTAPGQGITLLNHGVHFCRDCDDIIVRHLRIRVTTGGSSGDCLLFWGNQGGTVERVLVDHCSLMGATDENVNTWGSVQDVTFQWTIIAEGRRPHSMGWLSGAGADRVSIHHCLFANIGPFTPGGAGDQWPNVTFYEPMDGRWIEHRPAPASFRAEKPFAVRAVATQSASEAYELVLAGAGAKVRDADDLRVIDEVKKRDGAVGWGPQ